MKLRCPSCHSTDVVPNSAAAFVKNYKCKKCGRVFPVKGVGGGRLF